MNRMTRHSARIFFRKSLGRLLCEAKPIISRRAFAKLEMFLALGYWPDLSCPRSFNEKLCIRKLAAPHPSLTLCADKWAVRDYVRAKTGRDDILNEIYLVTEEPESIDFRSLPDQFVIKATHGSGWNLIVTDKSTLNIAKVGAQCRKWLRSKYSTTTRNFFETHYDGIRPRIIIERLIGDGSSTPLDYKFFCFHGNPRFIQVDADRFGDHRRNFYDIEWNELEFGLIYQKGPRSPRPSLLHEMTVIARKLSADFDFCRVDLYNHYPATASFGEITFFPESGRGNFLPRDWDYKVGELWHGGPNA
jgi:hypothetical protein